MCRAASGVWQGHTRGQWQTSAQHLTPTADMLAGAIYAMTVVPCASTLCVVNIRQTEAKVEAVLSHFIQLGHEVSQSSAQVGMS